MKTFDSRFTPREIFARMQGAWFEPRQGYIWQENTGATATTSGGQTIGLLIGLDKPMQLGPELLTNGDFSAGSSGWTIDGDSWTITTGAATKKMSYSGGSFYQSTPLITGKLVLVTVTTSVNNVSGIGVQLFTYSFQDPTIKPNTYQFLIFGHGTIKFSSVPYPNTGNLVISSVSAREVLSSYAVQTTAANRPLFGARRNLLTYTENFSNAAWVTLANGGGSVGVKTPNYGIAPDGTQTACRIQLDVSGGSAGAQSQIAQPITVAGKLTQGAWVKTADGSTVTIMAFSAVSPTLTVTNVWQRLSYTHPNELYQGWYFQIILIKGTTSNQADLLIWHPQSEIGSTATDYQRVTTATDYDAGRFPAIRHADSTDVLAAAMPAINVRRNLLTYSEQFDNVVLWTKQQAFVTPNVAIAPDGTTTADLLYEQANAANHNIYHTSSVSGAAVSTLSVFAKESTRRYLVLNISTTSTDWAIAAFDLRTGAVTQQSTGATGSIVSAYSISDRNGYFRCILTATTANANRSSALMLSNASTFVPASYGVVIYSGDGASGIHIWGAQHELGPIATDYQKITDWTSEAYSSSGSTYFATSSGMSSIHNQSIGTTYNLPAPQTDVYGVVVVPSRLPPITEQKLALYMQQLAGIQDGNFFWQEQALDGMTGQLLADDNDTILLLG